VNTKRLLFFSLILTLLPAVLFACASDKHKAENILSYIVDPKKQDLKLYWKDDKGQLIKSILNLKTWLDSKDKNLIFAMNGWYV
jgi:uncharacterized protein YigE (DUF2233 family)